MMGDRISNLPDELIHHIFYFLPSKLAVQTSVLSTRWRSLWASSSHLRFDINDITPYTGCLHSERLSSFVDAMLRFRDRSAGIKTFHFHTEGRFGQPHFRNWIHYALRHNIEELDLALFFPFDVKDDAELPRSVFTCKSLTVLRLERVRFESIASAILEKLTTLHLMFMYFEGSSLSKLVSGCPNLVDLLVEHCMVDELRVASDCVRLKTLSLAMGMIRRHWVDPFYIQIRAPHLSSLKLSVTQRHSREEESPCRFSNIFQGFPRIEALELKGYSIECIYKEIASSRVLPTFRNLKQLKVAAFLGEGRHIQAIIGLLNASPELKALAINNTRCWSREKPQKLRDIESELSIERLKSIKIHGFESNGTADKFLMFLRANAKALEQMLIVPRQQPAC